jgi:hypothetical protein
MKKTFVHLRFSIPVALVNLKFILAVKIIRNAQRKIKTIMIALPFLQRIVCPWREGFEVQTAARLAEGSTSH